MQGPLFVSRIAELGHLTARHPLVPRARRESSGLSVRCERFMAHLNAALDVVIPRRAPQWMVDTEARYGMLACNIYVSSVRNDRAVWSSWAPHPLISVLFSPQSDPQVQVTPIGKTPEEHADGEILTSLLRAALVERGGYSVGTRTPPCLDAFR